MKCVFFFKSPLQILQTGSLLAEIKRIRSQSRTTAQLFIYLCFVTLGPQIYLPPLTFQFISLPHIRRHAVFQRIFTLFLPFPMHK